MRTVRGQLHTIGHSTLPPGELERALGAHGIELLVDVRAHPGSRRLPHFAGDALARALLEAGIEYLHVPELGGRRRPVPGSANSGWRKEQFQGYADHMATEEFSRGLERGEAESESRSPCLMCAEALWCGCHRRLVADALVVRGWRVLHIMRAGDPAEHELTDFAVVDGERITYPEPQGSLGV